MGDTNTTYVLRQTNDGRWILKAFDHKGRSLGVPVTIDDAKEAWKVLWMMIGYGDLEDTIPVDIEQKGEFIWKGNAA